MAESCTLPSFIVKQRCNIHKKQSITDRQTDKIFTEYMLIYEGNLHKKKLERYPIRGLENHVLP